MPNTKKDHESDEKNPFIKQTIIEEKKDQRKRIVSAACLAVVFGMVAGPTTALTSYKQKHTKQKDKNHYTDSEGGDKH